jgi:hypothetical protein
MGALHAARLSFLFENCLSVRRNPDTFCAEMLIGTSGLCIGSLNLTRTNNKIASPYLNILIGSNL